MVKSFTSIKKGLGLFDIIQFGKYKGCRVDSIVSLDPAYFDYTRINYGSLWAKEVYEAVIVETEKRVLGDKRQRNAYTKLGIAALFNDYRNNSLYDMDDILFDDVPY